jgi:hypothetical protein
MTSPATSLARLIETDLGVDATYRHVNKRVVTGEPLPLAGLMLKWYEVHPIDLPVPPEIAQLARTYLLGATIEARGLGFVVLHRCGRDFYFLIVCSWRNSNELWETVFYKDGDAMPDFAPFPREGPHKPALCVWEMVPAWHEQKAWVSFLTSSRDEAAAIVWMNDLCAGDA